MSNSLAKGTYAGLIEFPKPWPQHGGYKWLEFTNENSTLTVTFDETGKLEILISATTGSFTETFQPVRFTSSTFVFLAIRWSNERVDLRINETDLLSNTVAGGTIVEIASDFHPLRPAEIIPNFSVPASTQREEEFFLLTLQDIENKLKTGISYEIIRASGLLRQLLIDGPPLVHVVNRNYRVRLEFRLMDNSQRVAPTADIEWLDVDPSMFATSRSVNTDLDTFLRTPTLWWKHNTATIKDVIRAGANAKGGVHFGYPMNEREKAILDWDDIFRFAGKQPTHYALIGICRVALHGLLPLALKILEEKHS